MELAAVVTSQRALGLRRRGDLEVHPQRSGRRQFWVVKDPVSLRYFKLRQEEFAILDWLDGHTALDQIKDRFDKTFAPQRVTSARLQSYLANLYRCGLLVSDNPGQAEQLLARHQRQRTEALWNSVSNVLAIRFRGIDPELMLAWVYPKLRWLFSTPVLLAGGVVIVSAALLVLTQLDTFWTRLPDFRAFINPGNLMWLLLVLAVTKVLHECGHALTCKHFGGECHEMGIMLLVFAPCLHCNVTDSWILRSRWQRIAISAAGIGVELILASVCTFAWWFSRPGFFHTMCLNVMAVCAVGTVLLNGNPLLRYDGYFILSDLLDIPNLWQESRSVVHRVLGRLFLGIDRDDRPIRGEHDALLLVYGAASMAYRAFVGVVIMCTLYSVLVPVRLGLLAHAVAGVFFAGLLAGAVLKIRGMLEDPLFRQRVSWPRALIVTLAVIGGGAFFLWVPLPHRLGTPVTLEPRNPASVYISVSGTLIDALRPGDSVHEGDVLARLDNPDLRAEVAQLEGEVSQALVKVQSLESLRAAHADVSAHLPTARERLADLRQRLTKKRREQESLVIQAPISGTVLPPPRRRGEATARMQLDRWTNTPLDERNRGCSLETGTLFCVIGDPDQHQAVLLIDESQLRYVQQGQPVRMIFEVAPATVFMGVIAEVARNALQVVPTELAVEQNVANRPDRHGLPRPLVTAYQARVDLSDHDCKLLTGARGRARIEIAPQTLYERLIHLVRTTFAGFSAPH